MRQRFRLLGVHSSSANPASGSVVGLGGLALWRARILTRNYVAVSPKWKLGRASCLDAAISSRLWERAASMMKRCSWRSICVFSHASFARWAKLGHLDEQCSKRVPVKMQRFPSGNCPGPTTYRASVKWAALTGSRSSRRSIWFARAVQLLAMLRIIASETGATSVWDSRLHSAACRLHSAACRLHS